MCIALLLGVPVIAYSAIKMVVGGAASCPGCIIYPVTPVILCEAPEFCTRTMAPDWTNPNVFYGTDMTDCRKSVDGGDTWNDCAANPSGTAVYPHYAVASDGSVLAAGNDSGGTVLRIRKSVNGGAVWSQVYESATEDGGGAFAGHTRLKCSQSTTEKLCVFVYKDVSNNAISVVSRDNGDSWVADTTIGTIVYNPNGLALTNDGLLGIVQPDTSNGFSNYKAVLWDNASWEVSTIWPATTGSCYEQFVLNGARMGICRVGATGTSYELRSETGVVQKTFTLLDGFTGAITSGLAYSVVTNWLAMLKPDSGGNTGIWISLDSGTSFIKVYSATGPIGSQSDVFSANGCMYFSYVNGGGSTVGKIC